MGTIRFWTYHNGGNVRLTLTEERPLFWVGGGATDEGYQEESCSWSLEGDTVTFEQTTRGRDCDGRYSSHAVSTCAIDRLTAVPAYDCIQPTAGRDGYRAPSVNASGHPIGRPDWKLQAYESRDHTAEACGY